MSDKIQPAHYKCHDPNYEPLVVAEKWNLGLHLGNLLKYIYRAGKKPGEDTIDDLRKGRFYLDRLIVKISSELTPLPGAPHGILHKSTIEAPFKVSEIKIVPSFEQACNNELNQEVS